MGISPGVLYLIPNLLDPTSLPEATLPATAMDRVRSIRHFVVEGEKAAWRLLSRLLEPEAAARVSMERLDEHSTREELPALLSPLEAGEELARLERDFAIAQGFAGLRVTVALRRNVDPRRRLAGLEHLQS